MELDGDAPNDNESDGKGVCDGLMDCELDSDANGVLLGAM